ncbi:MAG: tetratricopeptide repeat protein [Pirellula sp.]|nr:tetratricopeptide repeat protein [Pirellula sp.]
MILLFSFAGCRILRNRTENKQLVHARQLSLRGADALQRSRSQDAELLFSEAIKQSPMDERAHWGYATTLWNRGDQAKAIEHMREAIRLSGDNPQYLVQFGEMLLTVGNYPEAESAANAVLANNHKNPAAWALRGRVHQAKREWDNANDCYQRALLIQSDYPEVQLQLAEVYRTLGKPQKSLAVLDRMVDFRNTASHDPQALLYRGLALADLSQTPEAADTLAKEAADTLAKASERLPAEDFQKQLQIVHAQHRIGELVAARITLGRVRSNNAEVPEVARLQSMLDMSFAHLSDPVKPLTEPTSEEFSSPSLMANPMAGSEGWLRR